MFQPESPIQVPQQGSQSLAKPRRMKPIIIGVVAVLVVWGVGSRLYTRFELGRRAEQQAIPTVAVAKSSAAPVHEDLVLPGDVQAYMNAPIYARTNGYLKRWLVDIGTPVKAGQLLAEIDTPEVDQQLHQAEADVRTAEANEKLARSTAERWSALLKTDSVSKQETDERLGDYASKQALAASARANLRRLQELQGFQRITAPFDGTITARNTDVGQLVGNGSGHELFHIVDTRRLRVYVRVPQPYAPELKTGLEAELHFFERPTQSYPAKVVRMADALDPSSRTMLVELEVDNAKGELFPGGYTEVHFKMPAGTNRVHIPANALIYRRNGLMVAAPDAAGRVNLKPITVGRDYGTVIEVTSGLAPNETVIVNPPDSLVQNQQVRIVKGAEDQPGHKKP